MKQDCVNAGTVAKLCDEIQKLESERDALKAHAERLREMCELALDNHGRMLPTCPPQESWEVNQVTSRLVEAIAATPSTSLAERDADVARKAFIAGATDAAAFISQQLDLGKTDIDLDAGVAADKYIERIKNGE